MCKTCGLRVHATRTNRGVSAACTREQNTNLHARVYKWVVVQLLHTFCTRTYPQAYASFQSVTYRLYTLYTAPIISMFILYKEKRSY